MPEAIPTANLFYIITFYIYWDSFNSRIYHHNLKIIIKCYGKRKLNSWIALKVIVENTVIRTFNGALALYV